MNSLTCYAARVAVLVISLAFVSISPAESTARCTTSGSQPAPKFSHSSSHTVDGRSSVLTDMVCNHDDDGLVFSWAKALMTRGVNNPLTQGEPCEKQSYSANVGAVEQDNDAPIRYTQAGRIKRAGICTRTRNTTSASNAPLISSLETSFSVANARPIRLKIETLVHLDRARRTLRFRLRATHSNVILGLGSMSSFRRILASDDRFMALLKANSNPIGGFRRVSKLLRRRDVDWLAPSLRQDVPLFFANQKSKSIDIDFQFSISDSILSSMSPRTAAVFVLDEGRTLIATGKFVLWAPN